MKIIKVLHYDAFSSIANKGNPAGVVLDTDGLNDESMQAIAKSVGFNETVFVQLSQKADFRLRYFTPGHEINLCGHATVGSMYCLKDLGIINADKSEITIETNVGILPIRFNKCNGELQVMMKQDKPEFMSFQGSVSKLAECIRLTEEEIDDKMPVVYGSTGTWTLLVPIRSLNSFSKMKPNNSLFPEILAENSRASIHPFCLETYDKRASMHARHFSSPYSGTIEDPVTGTASGVMGAYYLQYVSKETAEAEFLVEQGQEIGKDGRVVVMAKRNGKSIDVFISGTAVYVKELKVSYV